MKYDWLYLENGKMKCHPCVNTRQNNPFSAGSGCTNFSTSLTSDIYDDTTSISCKRSVCDPLKLKMTPKVNYLGVTMTPENFFEGKTLNISIILLSFISYKGIKLTLKWIFPFFLVISAYLEFEIEIYIFFHILIKVEISLLFKLLSS